MGNTTSYIESYHSIRFNFVIDDHSESFVFRELSPISSKAANNNTAIIPGRKMEYYFDYSGLKALKRKGTRIILQEVTVQDEIGNIYRTPVDEQIQARITEEIFG